MGLTVVCLGSGPSLTPEDATACVGQVTIAINDTIELIPRATVCFAADYTWWDRHHGLPWFRGRKIALDPFGRRYPDVERWRRSGVTGLDLDDRPTLRTGGNSGYAAINLAVKLFPMSTTIVLVGYDMQAPNGKHHHHDPHPGDAHLDYAVCRPRFETLVAPLKARGIAVYNASRSTALTAFPCADLATLLH